MAKTRITLFSILIAVTLPAGAAARSRPGLPSGNSGAYQYVESIPTAGGSKPDAGVRSSPKSSPGSAASPSPVSASTQRSLVNDGSTGRAAYSLDLATAPKARAAKTKPRSRSRVVSVPPGTSPPGPSSGGSLPSGTRRGSAVVGALTGFGDGGSGVALPIILIVIAGCAVALRFRRHPAADE